MLHLRGHNVDSDLYLVRVKFRHPISVRDRGVPPTRMNGVEKLYNEENTLEQRVEADFMENENQ